MKLVLLYTIGFIVLVMVAFATSSAEAQTTAPGPYYATPSWDQQLPASTRFIVLSNWDDKAVLDRETGLVWERYPMYSTNGWLDAMNECTANRYVSGRMGWRLPTVQEIMSLMLPGYLTPLRLPPENPFVIYSEVAAFWTSTTSARDPTLAWVVPYSSLITSCDLSSLTPSMCAPYVDAKVFPIYVAFPSIWCVRGASGADAQ